MSAALQPLLDALRARVLTEAIPSSCILTCKAAQRLLDAVGIEAKPLATDLLVYNANWQPGDPQAIAVDVADHNGTGVSHLVLLAPGVLIDPSLDQASRPERGIPLAPTAFPVTAEVQARIDAGLPVTYARDSGVTVVYTPRPHDRRYTVSPNWGNRDRSVVERIVGDVLRTMTKVPRETY